MRERTRSQGLLPRTVLKDAVPLSRSDFTHGLAPCPKCGLPLDSTKDVDELIREDTDLKVAGARVTHRRCGASFQVRLED